MKHEYQDMFMAEINVTPFVDVLLILLVLFIITLPVITQQLPVNLPQAELTKPPPSPEVSIYVLVDSKGNITYEGKNISLDELVFTLSEFDKETTTVIIQADKANQYGNIIGVLSALSNEGFLKVGLSVETTK